MNKPVSKITPIGQGASLSSHPSSGEIDRLFDALGGTNLPPRTKKLSSAHIIKKAKKLVEEASEMSFEAVFGRRRGVVEESVDLIYHMVVLWRACSVKPNEVWREMHQRADEHGVAGKLPKRKSRRH